MFKSLKDIAPGDSIEDPTLHGKIVVVVYVDRVTDTSGRIVCMQIQCFRSDPFEIIKWTSSSPNLKTKIVNEIS